MQACFDGGGSSGSLGAGNGVTLEGVAATGAPISNGTVEIMDAEGRLIPGLLKTDRYGKYSANVGGFESPYLIVVSPLSGDPVLSMASQEDVRQGKKVNVTPLTHVVVSNVYGETNTEAIKALQADAKERREELVAKIENKKKELQESLKNAMEALNVDASIDIMNGALSAGSGAGMDKLLDAIELRQEKAADSDKKSTISLKGGTPIVEVTPVTVPVPTPVDETKLSAINSQLTALKGIKDFYEAAIADYRSIGLCNGDAISDTTKACDKEKLHEKMLNHMHTDYLYSGLNADMDTWSWFCEQANGHEATDADTCEIIKVDNMEMTDFTIVSYEKKIDGTEVAYVNFNTYENGELRGSEGDYVRKDAEGTWKFYGNQRLYPIYMNSRTFLRKEYDKSVQTSKSSHAQLDIWVNQEGSTPVLANVTNPVFVAVDSSGSEMGELNKALRVANNQDSSVAGLELAANGMFPLYLASKICPEQNPDVPTETTCNDWDANRITLSAEALALMNSSQRFFLRYDDNGTPKEDEFFISKPLIVEEKDESKFFPSYVSEETLCVEPRTSYEASAASGTYLNWANFYAGLQGSDTSYYNLRGETGFDEATSATIPSAISTTVCNEAGCNEESISLPADAILNYGGFYLSVDDQYGRQFVKEISCKYNWVQPSP